MFCEESNQYIKVIQLMKVDRDNDLIVIGYEHHNTIGAIRATRDIDANVYFISIAQMGKPRYVGKSNSIKRHNYFEASNENQAINILKSLPLKGKKHVVVSCGDKLSHVIDIRYEELSKLFILPNINHTQGKLSALQSKATMCEIVERYGVRIPQSLIYNVQQDNLCDLDIQYPCFIKAISSTEGPKDLNVYTDLESLSRGVNELSKACEIIQIQEFIKKDKEIIVLGCADGNGNVCLPCMIDKYRQWPPKVGGTTYGLVTPRLERCVNPELISRIVAEIKYSGVFSFEFIIKDNKLYFIETNFRNDATGYSSVYGGVNLINMWYRSVIGLPVNWNLRVSREYMVMSDLNDINNAIHFQVPVIQWLYEFITAQVKFYWDKADMKPFFSYLISRAKSKLFN